MFTRLNKHLVSKSYIGSDKLIFKNLILLYEKIINVLGKWKSQEFWILWNFILIF